MSGQTWRLQPPEVDEYVGQGLVRPAVRFDAGTVAAMRTLLEETLSATPGQRPESIVCPHIEGMSGLPRGITERWLAICTDSRLVDLVASVLGSDIILWGSQLFCKPAGTGLAVPWHQDGHFWPIRPLATCSVWIAIDDVDLENGAMQYIPGSHRERVLFEHEAATGEELALNAQLAPPHLDLERAAVDALGAGELSLHDVYLVHGSEPNRSARRRAAFVIRYMPASSHYDRSLAKPGSSHVDAKLASRPIYLLRGDDRTAKSGLVDLRHQAGPARLVPSPTPPRPALS